jgi:hypothetical protein
VEELLGGADGYRRTVSGTMTARHREEQRAVEDGAAAAAAFVLGAKAQRRDNGRGEGMRDFDLVFDGGHPEPLEGHPTRT